jgi:glycosyltransferase involved in cell wall biosynthesis
MVALRTRRVNSSIILTVRVAIDARKLHDFGIGTYIRNILRQLARLDRETEYLLICQPRDRELGLSLGDNFRVEIDSSPPYSLREQVSIPWRLVRTRSRLLHEPHYVLPPLVPCRSVVTIHDCIHLRFPQYLPNRAALTYARAQMGSAARRSDRILTVSEASKRDILHYFPVGPEKITVIHNAIDERFASAPPEQDVRRVAERYQLEGRFVLYVGNVKPHKNLERLIDAFHLMRQTPELETVQLVVIGDDISKYAALRRAVHRYNLHKFVRFLGFLPDETLAIVYRLAAVFVFPSLYEGFGLPPLEAMASGTPVVTSNVSSLPEVTGDAALLVDPLSSEAIADAMRRVLTDRDLAADLSARGIARSRTFSWERAAARIHDIYMEVGRA